MPKIKTNRAAAKRFKKTGTGKLKRNKAFRGLSQKERETFMELFLRIYKNTEAQTLLPEETITQKGDDEKWKN